MKEAVRSGDCAGRGRGPGSRQWCTNYSEVKDFEFIPQGSECNGDVTRRRHGAADRGGTVCGNATHTT